MSDFEIVKDKDFDRKPGARRNGLVVDAVLAGEVVFLPGAKRTGMHAGFARASDATHRITTRSGERDGVVGIYVWRIER